MYDYLVAHPEADPTGPAAAGPGGPAADLRIHARRRAARSAHHGFDTLDTRRATAFERDLEARFVTLCTAI
jgi:hypothetical protein